MQTTHLIAYMLLGAQLLSWFLYYRRHYHRRPLPQEHSAVQILYASQSGQAQTLAENLAAQLNAPSYSLNEFTALTHHAPTLIIIASTTGDGEAPDNASRYRKIRQLPLQNSRYHLLGLGDKRYPRYCAFAHALNSELQASGATPASDLCEVDNLDPSTIAAWQTQLAQTLDIQLTTTAPCYHTAKLVAREYLNPDSAYPLYHLQLECSAISNECALIECEIPTDSGTIRRQYSTAGASPCGKTEGIHLIIRLQQSENGVYGQGSYHLTQALAVGETVAIRALSHPITDLPDTEMPLILLATGSGMAGILGILTRYHARFDKPSHWVIFGERDPVCDRPYWAHLNALKEKGVIEQLDYCHSRGAERLYVQHMLARYPDKLREWLGNGAILYLCGSKHTLGNSVVETLKSILGETEYDALYAAERIRLDVY